MDPQHPKLPDFLEPAAEVYRKDPYGTQHVFNETHIVALRCYLREWMIAHAKEHPQAQAFADRINSLKTQQDVCQWLHDALQVGISPI